MNEKMKNVEGVKVDHYLLLRVGFKKHKEGYLYGSDEVDLFVKKSGVSELSGGELHPTNEWSVFIDRTGRDDVFYLHELNEIIQAELGFELKLEESSNESKD